MPNVDIIFQFSTDMFIPAYIRVHQDDINLSQVGSGEGDLLAHKT